MDTSNITNPTAKNYFTTNPDAIDDVMKATYAYHLNPREIDNAHYFTGEVSNCLWCNRSKLQVRWDNLPYSCQKRPTNAFPNITLTIKSEEEKYLRQLNKMDSILSKHTTINANLLFEMKRTHGFQPDDVMDFFDIISEDKRNSLLKDTKILFDNDSTLSKSNAKPKPIISINKQ